MQATIQGRSVDLIRFQREANLSPTALSVGIKLLKTKGAAAWLTASKPNFQSTFYYVQGYRGFMQDWCHLFYEPLWFLHPDSRHTSLLCAGALPSEAHVITYIVIRLIDTINYTNYLMA